MGKLFAMAHIGAVLLVGVWLGPAGLGRSSQLTSQALKQRAEKLSAVARGVAPADEEGERPLQIRAPQVGERAGGNRFGWYVPEIRELVVDRHRPESIDDALYAMVIAELRHGLGEPGSPWFARGVAHALVGSAGGLSLTAIESRTEPMTPAEIISGSDRPSLTCAPREARLARCLMVELGAGIEGAWKVKVRGDADLEGRLAAAWERSLGKSGISPILAYPRSVGGGEYAVLESALFTKGADAVRRELSRLAAAGVRGVEIPVDVALPGRGEPSAVDPAIALPAASSAGFPAGSPAGSPSGSAAVVELARFAASERLSVVLAPRFTPALAGELRQDAAAVEAYGQRRAEAVEALSWIAEFARADGLVLFDEADLCQPADAGISAELRAARRSLRRRSLVGSRPFAGDRLAFSSDSSVFESARAEDFSGEFRGALAVINLKVGLKNEIPALGFTRK